MKCVLFLSLLFPIVSGYYSDWSVYAQTVSSNGYTYMSSTFTVPSKPENHGPAKQSSVYIFNGLEDGSGVHGKASVILQPVLQYGKSGCLLNPLKWDSWYASSYVVDGSARAKCGSLIEVSEGDEVVGVMERGLNDNIWNVTTYVKGKEDVKSVNSVDLGDIKIDAAYATLEGMVVYTCDTYPSEGRIDFTDNILKDGNGKEVDTIKWETEVRHDECNQGVEVGDDGDVSLVWDATL